MEDPGPDDRDADRFVFGADPTRERWWGRPLAETRWSLELTRLLADPVLYGGGGIPRGDGRPVVLMPGFLAGDQTLGVLGAWLRIDRLPTADLRLHRQHGLLGPRAGPRRAQSAGAVSHVTAGAWP